MWTYLDSFTMCLVVKIGLGSQKPKNKILGEIFLLLGGQPGTPWGDTLGPLQV
jgi:hypothetical protein